MSDPGAYQIHSTEQVDNNHHRPIRVAVYGSSLFLTAVTFALCNHAAVNLLYFLNSVTTAAILRQIPAILLWQDHLPPEDIAALLQAGIWLLNVDEQESYILIQHRGRPRQILPIRQSTDLITWIMQADQDGVFR